MRASRILVILMRGDDLLTALTPKHRLRGTIIATYVIRVITWIGILR